MENEPWNYHEATQAYNAAELDISYANELKAMAWHGVWTPIPHLQVPEGCPVLGSHTVFCTSVMKTAMCHDARLGSLQKGTHRFREWTIMTPLPQLHIWNLSKLF